MNLSLASEDVRDIIIACDAQGTGVVSYKSFLRALASKDISEDYDPMDAARIHELKSLEHLANKKAPTPSKRMLAKAEFQDTMAAASSPSARTRAPWDTPPAGTNNSDGDTA